jgi:hypothetical protein
MIKQLSSLSLSLALLGGAAVVAFLLIATRSTPTPQSNGEKSVIVELAPLRPQSADIIIEAFGVARAANEATLQAQVAARIEAVHPNLRIGGVIPAGEPAIRLEKADFEASVAAAEAAVARAQSNLVLEEGRRKVAEREAELIGDAAPDLEIDRALALREPQLADAKAALRQAESDLKTAQLSLQRTDITFPFDALVLNETADVGDFAAIGASLGAVADVSAFWLEVEIPQTTLQRLRSRERAQGRNAAAQAFPSGAPSTDASSPGNAAGQAFRNAEVISLSGSVSDQSRLGVALLAVEDPLARLPENAGAPSILLGSYVDVEINAGDVADVYQTPIAALRENNKVAVRAANGRLAIRDIDVVHRQASIALIRGAFEPEDELVVSRLANAIPGTLLQTAEEADRKRSQEQEDDEDDEQRVSDRRAALADHVHIARRATADTLTGVVRLGSKSSNTVVVNVNDFRRCAETAENPEHPNKDSERQHCDTIGGGVGHAAGRIAARLSQVWQG